MTEEQAQALIEELARTNAMLEAVVQIVIEEHKHHYHRPPWWRRALSRLRRRLAREGDGVAA